jgi:hypothetical protein
LGEELEVTKQTRPTSIASCKIKTTIVETPGELEGEQQTQLYDSFSICFTHIHMKMNSSLII